ncbi:hypothetical protein QFC20_002566 [Naganishia adeliensis]|uniref:Uncharacterized protein n=1 Tax=Naganishia adeliensis TaxID=92952 RepID=A0ACC2WJI9_9TREE|nr:hypothetical protein QFC20_002566 [Naganishia adeliensis]
MSALSTNHTPPGSQGSIFSANPTTLQVSFPPFMTQRTPIDMAPDGPRVSLMGSYEEQSMIPDSVSITHTSELSEDPGDDRSIAWQKGSVTIEGEHGYQDGQESGNPSMERGSRPTLEVTVDWIGESLDESMRNSIKEIVKREAKRYDDDEYPGPGNDFSALLERIGSALSAAFGWAVDKLDSTKEYWGRKLLVGFLVVRGVATIIWVDYVSYPQIAAQVWSTWRTPLMLEATILDRSHGCV